MATQVRETKAGSSISAYVILNKKGEHVATVNAHFANSGRVTVDVWNIGDKAALRCYDAAMSALQQPARAAALAKAKRDALAKYDWRKEDDATNWAAHDLFGMQQGSAGGYGYDKFTAALSGLWIDGHRMADHCGRSSATEKMLKAYNKERNGLAQAGVGADYVSARQRGWDERAAKIGAHFANGYTSLYLEAGLKRLETLGYRVIQAI